MNITSHTISQQLVKATIFAAALCMTNAHTYPEKDLKNGHQHQHHDSKQCPEHEKNKK